MLFGWGLYHGTLLICPALARHAYRRLTARHRDHVVAVAELNDECQVLAGRALHAADDVVMMMAKRTSADQAEVRARLPHAPWDLGQDLQKITRLGPPAEQTETDPDAALIQQAMDAVAARVESLEAEADQLRHRLAQESEIEAARQRALEDADAEWRAALRREEVLDVVARAEARREIHRPDQSSGPQD